MSAQPRYLAAKVEKAIQVKGLLTTYTHFVIGVSITSPIPRDLPEDNSQTYPIAPYHTRILKRSRRLCTSWAAETRVERRYSELVDLRSYLVMAYPMLIFPPLPQKSVIDNLNTTLASEMHLADQRRSILFFLDNLLSMNHVVLYDHHVMNALQQSRDVFTNDGLVAMRADLAAMTSAQAHIDDYKTMHQRAAATSTAALVEGTSKAFKGFFSYMSGNQTPTTPDIETIRKHLESDANYTKWVPLLRYVRELNISLADSADQLQKLLVPLDEMNVATLNITGPMIEYDNVLNSCGCFKPLCIDVEGFAQVFNAIGTEHRKDTDRLKVRVVGAMKLEAGWMASAEAAIESLLALFAHVGCTMADFYKCNTAEAINMKHFLEKSCQMLSLEIREVTGDSHERRVRQMLSAYVDIFSSSLAREAAAVASTSYYSRRLGEGRQSDADDWAEQVRNLPWKTGQ